MEVFRFQKKFVCSAIALLTFSSAITAHRKCIVIDASTRQPLRDVFVRCDNDSSIKTPWNGVVSLPDSFRTVSFCHPRFERRIIKQKELEDSIFMLPSAQMLNEVVVYGKRIRRPDLVGISSLDKSLAAAKMQGGFNILGLINLITNPIIRSIEHKKEVKRQKTRSVLDNY